MSLWLKPKKPGFAVRVKDVTSEHYNREGQRQASRPDGSVLIYFPVTKTKGELVMLDWSQCERL